MPSVVYRVYDVKERLLYVGCTRDIGHRMANHQNYGNPSEASWAVNLYGTRTETEEYADHYEAREAERRAIESGSPWFNRQHNPTRYRRMGGEWVRIGDEYEPVRADTPEGAEWLAAMCGVLPDA